MSPFQTSTILLLMAGLSAWLSLEGKPRLVAAGLLLGIYLILFTLGICMARLGYFVRCFCRSRQPGAGVVLTFDDGPDPFGTKRLLGVLSSHGVKATFFPIGRRSTRPKMPWQVRSERPRPFSVRQQASQTLTIAGR